MKQNVTKGYLVLFLIFVLISVVSFALPVEKGAAFWVTYAFTLVAIAAQVGIWKRAFAGKGTLKSKFLGIPVIHVGITFLIIQLIAFAVFMILPTLPVWLAVVVCTIILAISALCAIAGQAGANEINRVEEKIKVKRVFIQFLQNQYFCIIMVL